MFQANSAYMRTKSKNEVLNSLYNINNLYDKFDIKSELC